MALSSEEQLAVVMHLASNGAQAADIKKQLKKVCGNTALPDSQLEKCVEEEKKKMSPQCKETIAQCKETTNNQNTVRKILSKKMKMVKDGDCWKPVFVEENIDEGICLVDYLEMTNLEWKDSDHIIIYPHR